MSWWKLGIAVEGLKKGNFFQCFLMWNHVMLENRWDLSRKLSNPTRPPSDQEKFQEWKEALKEVGQLAGQCLQNYRDEAEFVSKIVEELEKMQSPGELHVADHPVGIRSRVEELMLKLRLDNEDVLVVVVHGISGIGKTTIVKATYNRIAAIFDVSCFIADIHSRFGSLNWKVELQNELISCLTRNPKHPLIMNSSHNDGVTMIRWLMSRQKTLLVLDDVDNFQQLESLIGIDLSWLYKGSRIIVTTRDKQSLGYIPFTSYQTRLLNRRESLNLFTRILFSRDDSIYTDFIEQVVGHAGGIPLVIKVWGSHFRQFKREQWPSILEKLKRIPHGDVQKQFQISYDSLDRRAKRLFLDIVFFFLGWYKGSVMKVLEDEDSGFFPEIEIQYLVDKSLVEISETSVLVMHDAIREMGEEIVRQENEDEPGRRTRLMIDRDVLHVLRECSGTQSLETICLASPFEDVIVLVEALRKMRNLRLIHFSYLDFHLNGLTSEYDKFSPCLCFKKLRYMEWSYLPFKSLDTFDMHNVVILRLKDSRLEILWEGLKSLKKLRILDVNRSSSLTKTGDFYGLENLEELYLSHCTNLEELDSSICHLHKLAILDIRHCNLLMKRIPVCKTIGKLPSLRQLKLGPFELEPHEVFDTILSLQESLLQLHQLNNIVFIDCCENMQWLPNLPRNMTSIQIFCCPSLVKLPLNMSELKSLTVLVLEDCPKLGTGDPHFLMKVTGLTNLRYLSIIRCSVPQVPTEIGNLVSLKRLDLSGNPFSSLPDSLSNLLQLDYLHIKYCNQLRLLPLLPSNLMYINAFKCSSLDVMPFDTSYKPAAQQGSPFCKQLLIDLPWKKELPDWCSCRLGGGVLSFVSPMHLSKRICGMILCANSTPKVDYLQSPYTLEMLNKTKNTSQRLQVTGYEDRVRCIIFYPLDHTTLVVEPGDTVVLQFYPKTLVVWSCGLRLIYENDVVDPKVVFQNDTFDFR